MKSLALITEMEAKGIKLYAILHKDSIPPRDAIDPLTPEEFSE